METELLHMIIGPAGAVCTMAIVLAAVWRFAVTRLWPFLTAYVDRQQTNLERLMTAHDDDRTLFRDSMEKLWVAHKEIHSDVDDIKTDIKELKTLYRGQRR